MPTGLTFLGRRDRVVYLGGSACYGNGKNTREIPEQSPWRQEPELTYLRRRWRGGMLGAMATAGEMRYGLRRPIPRRSVGGSMTPAATSAWSDCQILPGPVDKPCPPQAGGSRRVRSSTAWRAEPETWPAGGRPGAARQPSQELAVRCGSGAVRRSQAQLRPTPSREVTLMCVWSKARASGAEQGGPHTCRATAARTCERTTTTCGGRVERRGDGGSEP